MAKLNLFAKKVASPDLADFTAKNEGVGRAAMQAAHAAPSAGARPRRKGLGFDNVADTISCLFAIFLCLVNALVWAFVSGMPVIAILWVAAAAACLKLQSWAKNG